MCVHLYWSGYGREDCHYYRSSGIGRASAIEFVKNGATVIGVGRNESDLGKLRDETRELSGILRTHLADVTEIFKIHRLVSESVEHFGGSMCS